MCLLPSLIHCVNESAARHELALGNTYVSQEGVAPPKSEVDPKVSFIRFTFERSFIEVRGRLLRSFIELLRMSILSVNW